MDPNNAISTRHAATQPPAGMPALAGPRAWLTQTTTALMAAQREWERQRDTRLAGLEPPDEAGALAQYRGAEDSYRACVLHHDGRAAVAALLAEVEALHARTEKVEAALIATLQPHSNHSHGDRPDVCPRCAASFDATLLAARATAAASASTAEGFRLAVRPEGAASEGNRASLAQCVERLAHEVRLHDAITTVEPRVLESWLQAAAALLAGAADGETGATEPDAVLHDLAYVSLALVMRPDARGMMGMEVSASLDRLRAAIAALRARAEKVVAELAFVTQERINWEQAYEEAHTRLDAESERAQASEREAFTAGYDEGWEDGRSSKSDHPNDAHLRDKDWAFGVALRAFTETRAARTPSTPNASTEVSDA